MYEEYRSLSEDSDRAGAIESSGRDYYDAFRRVRVGVPSSAFSEGDVYIDFPYEEVMFHYEKKAGKLFRKFYGSSTEDEIPHNLKIYTEARIAGEQTTAAEYRRSRPRFPRP
jgi:hypothetical protein